MLTFPLLFIAAFLLCISVAKHHAAMHLFVAGYDGTIVPYSIDTKAAKFERLDSGIEPGSAGDSPSWIAFSPPAHGTEMYSVTNAFYSTSEDTDGLVFSHTYDVATHKIFTTGRSMTQRKKGTSTGGSGPVSALVGHGPSAHLLFVANYDSGSASVLKIHSNDGTLNSSSAHAKPYKTFQFTRKQGAPAVGPVADRQDHSYAHQVAILPTGGFVYVVDLGVDQIHHLKVHGDGEVDFVGSTDVPAGSGPRHMTFYEESDGGHIYAYLASELANTVTSFKVNRTTGHLHAIQHPVVASPAGVPLSGPGILPTNRTTAEIAVAPQGTHVYVSNRGDKDEDRISIFERDPGSGHISLSRWVKSGGRMPRHFSLSSDSLADTAHAHWLAVGHQTDQNIVLFKRDTTSGDLTKVDTKHNVGQVAFTGFAPF